MSRRYRNSGKIPAVLAQKGGTPMHLLVDAREFERLLKTRERVQAVCALVDKHKIEYSKLVAEYRVHFERSSAA